MQTDAVNAELVENPMVSVVQAPLNNANNLAQKDLSNQIAAAAG